MSARSVKAVYKGGHLIPLDDLKRRKQVLPGHQNPVEGAQQETESLSRNF